MSILEDQRQRKIMADKAAAYDKMMLMQEQELKVRDARESGILDAVEYMLKNTAAQNTQPDSLPSFSKPNSGLVDYAGLGSEDILDKGTNPWESI